MSVSSCRSQVVRARQDIADLQKQKAHLAEDRARAVFRIHDAQRSISLSSSASTIQSKRREIERYNGELASVEKKIADMEQRISNKHADLNRAEEQLQREEKFEFDRQQREEKRQTDQREQQMQKQQAEARRVADENARRFRDVNVHLQDHDYMHGVAMAAIQDLQRLPDTITVLFIAANPLDQNQLRLDEEIRSIEQKIRLSQHRDSVRLVAKWAVRPPDLLQALNEYKPHIVHFSGHGSDQDEIIFQDDAGQTKAITKDAIVQTMKFAADNIRLVIFNTCYSRNQAEAVAQHVDAAVGMNTSIGDEAARVFAAQFYSAIGFGRSVQDAFNQAKALLMLEGIKEDQTPELFTRAGVDPIQLVLVKPQVTNAGS